MLLLLLLLFVWFYSEHNDSLSLNIGRAERFPLSVFRLRNTISLFVFVLTFISKRYFFVIVALLSSLGRLDLEVCERRKEGSLALSFVL